MPSKKSLDTLTSFIGGQDADTLASILIELAEEHEVVHERLVRLQLSSQPKALAAAFRKTLAAWKRSTKYLGYAQVGDFGHELEAWLGQIERELMPQDAAEALALAEAFIEADEVFFNSADDSGGVIGDAMRAGCLLWLKAASRCESPASAWPDRIAALVAADQYGAREELLRRADLLLSEAAMRGLVVSCEAQLDDSIAHPSAAPERVNWPAAQASTALGRTGEACAVRQRIFEASLAVGDLHAWLDLLPPPEQAHAIERARQLAAAHSDPVVVAPLLRAQHKRKSSFWAHVSGARQADDDAEPDPQA